jgi:phosphate starvation-inducible protein PhoH
VPRVVLEVDRNFLTIKQTTRKGKETRGEEKRKEKREEKKTKKREEKKKKINARKEMQKEKNQKGIILKTEVQRNSIL